MSHIEDQEEIGGFDVAHLKRAELIQDAFCLQEAMAVLVDVLKLIEGLSGLDREVVLAYSRDDASAAADACARRNPKITNRTVHYNRARQIMNRFVGRLHKMGLTWPPA